MNWKQNHCGCCEHFADEDTCGQGTCSVYDFETTCDSEACEEFELKLTSGNCPDYGKGRNKKRCGAEGTVPLYCSLHCWECFD